jgi:hypothetical protein
MVFMVWVSSRSSTNKDNVTPHQNTPAPTPAPVQPQPANQTPENKAEVIHPVETLPKENIFENKAISPPPVSATEIPELSKEPPNDDYFGLRVWKFKNGTKTIEGKYSGILENEVILIKQNGEKVKVPIDKLCSEDQVWVKERKKKK